MGTVLNPGSFDPIHLGHLDVIEQAVELFGHVTVVVMFNHEKPGGMFTVDERQELIRTPSRKASISKDDVAVSCHDGLAVDAATGAGTSFIVKGLRTAADFEIEQQMALTNHSVTRIRTVYLLRRRQVHQQPLRARDRPVRWSCRAHGAARSGRRLGQQVLEQDHHSMSYDDDYEDEYDEYDEIDDEYPEPGEGYVGDAETLLRRSIDIIATAPMPLSSSPRIDRDEIIELLEEVPAASARRIASGPLDAQGTPGVRRQGAP